jgi:DNA-binding transcriptional LysR family regulator
MHVSRVDLNLFVVLEAICTEGSITRAATRLNLSQPAVSHALGRLRELYADPLFVRVGNGMQPTPFTKRLMAPVREALGQLQSTLQPAGIFDPAGAGHQFSVSLPDVVEGWLLPAVMAVLEKEAPGVQLVSTRVRRREMEKELASGRLDLAFDVPLPVAPAVRHRALSEDRFVVAMRKGHPLLEQPWSVDTYLAARHVVVSSRRSGLSLEDAELARRSYRRTIALRCTGYHAACSAIAATDLLLTAPGAWLERVKPVGLALRPVPFPLSGMALHLYWHESTDQDPAGLWLRTVFASLMSGACIDGGPGDTA